MKAMKVIITGGGGFIGQCLAKQILARGELRSEESQTKVTSIILADIVAPETFLFDELRDSSIVTVHVGDVSDKSYCESLVGAPKSDDSLSIFHLGAVMSGTGEANFDIAMTVNLQGTMNMLESARRWQAAHPDNVRPTFLFTSAGATIGSGHPADWVSKDDVISDATRATPHTTYGMTKACCELLLSDYSRRKFIDGRGVRLPTVVVRAGAPNAATTSCFSAVVREPLKGETVVLPIGHTVCHAATSYRAAVSGILNVHDAAPAQADELLGFDRTVFLPSRSFSLSQLSDALLRVVSPESSKHLGAIKYDVDEFVSSVVGGFPTKVDADRALQLGAPPTPDLETMVREYCEDFAAHVHPSIKLVPIETPEALGQVDGLHTVALITGGGSGIGRAVALRLAQGGWGGNCGKGSNADGTPCCFGLVLAGRRRSPLEETEQLCLAASHAAGVKLVTLVVPTDVRNEQEVKSLFTALKNRFGRLDLLFNNAGINISPASVEDIDSADWKRIIDTNLTACWMVAKESMLLMGQQIPQGGRIINNGSISADSPRPGAAPYTASKHAVLGLTKSIALDGRKINVACGQIDFGNVTSDLTVKMATGMPQANGTVATEPTFSAQDAADTVHTMAALPLHANIFSMTVMATQMPYVGRG